MDGRFKDVNDAILKQLNDSESSSAIVKMTLRSGLRMTKRTTNNMFVYINIMSKCL